MFPDLTLFEFALVTGMSVFASIVGGLAGYGTGLLLPLVLVPMIGGEATVPVIAVAALFTNAGRMFAMWHAIEWRKAVLMVPCAIPAVMFSAWMFTGLDNRGATIVIGLMLMVLVPLRRILARSGFVLRGAPLALLGGVYGLVTGGSTGAGVILVSFLMAAGLAGPAVIATDAVISIIVGLAKASTFATLGALPPKLLVFALFIGLTTLPGGFIAKVILDRLPLRIHALMLDCVVLAGGLAMVWRAWQG